MVRSTRLVTLWGPPGVGKTRLAVEVARRCAAHFTDGAFWIDLAPVTEPSRVASAVAAELWVEERPKHSVFDCLVAYLRSRRMLLVFDNCEHLTGAVAELVECLLKACPNLTVVVTSREALTLSGERRWVVSPLTEADGVDLFLARARDTVPGFEVGSESAAALRKIWLRLDGIPLAIELAAARVAVLSPTEIAARLDDRVAILDRATRTADGRHQTLRATLDWSYDLLSEGEKTVLRRLSVFAGGFSLDAVEAVCSGGGLKPGATFETLAALVAKSLVTTRTAGSDTRYGLLETVHAYAADRLDEAKEREEVEARHGSWFVEFAASAEPGLRRRNQLAVLASVDADFENLRTAMTWALAQSDRHYALRLAGSLTVYWRVRCRFVEGRNWLDAALGDGRSPSDPLIAKALWGQAFMHHMCSESAKAIPLLDQSLAIYRDERDIEGQAQALFLLASCWGQLRNSELALELYEDAAKLAQTTGDDWCLGHCLALTGATLLSRGQGESARRAIDEALGVARRSGEPQAMRMALLEFGHLALVRGDWSDAESAFMGAGRICGDLGERYGVACALIGLGQAAMARGDHDVARVRLEEALRAHEQAGSISGWALALTLLGEIALSAKDLRRARAHFEDAAVLGARIDSASPAALLGLGRVALLSGELEVARSHLEQAHALSGDSGYPHDIATSTFYLADLSYREGDLAAALTGHKEALALYWQLGETRNVVVALAVVASVVNAEGRTGTAVRLLAASESLRQSNDLPRGLLDEEWLDARVAEARSALTKRVFDDAWADGSCLSIDDAVALVNDRNGRKRGSVGWESLTPAEERVVALVAQGLSDHEIAERLFVSPRTVQTHLRHVFNKLEVPSRTVLALRAAHRAGLQPSA